MSYKIYDEIMLTVTKCYFFICNLRLSTFRENDRIALGKWEI